MKKNALLIGAFVLAALVLMVAGVMALGGRSLFSKQLHAVVYFEGSVRGLYVGAPVTFRGVKIGDVDSIGVEVNPTTLATRIPVVLILGTDTLRMGGPDGKRMSDLPNLVRRGLRARLILQSVVTGQTSIDLDFKPETPLHLLAGRHSKVPEIPVMRDKLDDLLEQVSNLPLSELVNDMRQTLKATREAMTVGTVAMDALQQRGVATLASIERLSDTTRGVLLQTQPDLLLTLQGTRRAAQSAQLAMDQLADLSAPGAPLRADLETSMQDLSQAARSLRSFSDQLERQPSILLFGKKAAP